MTAQRILSLLATSMLIASGCSDEITTAPQTNTAEARADVVTENGVQRVEGEIGPGASYALFVPESWNGQLVLYAHGYRDPGDAVELRDQDNLALLQERLLGQHYAVAYSSYSENGYAIRDGMQRTAQLRGVFASHFGRPTRTLLMGHSLGGLVALGLAERFPQHYDGALLMCGIAGGSRATVDYIGNLRVLFDFFYPGVLPGNLLHMPEGTRPVEDIEQPAIAAMTANVQGAFMIAALMQGRGTPIPHIQVLGPVPMGQTLVGSIVYALSFHARGFEDLIDRTHGHSPFDNLHEVYTGALPAGALAAVNAGVDRFGTTPDAQNFLATYYEPTGELRIPVVTLNNPFDPISPALHMTSYRQQVAAAGSSAQLVEHTTANPFAYGHCAMSVDDTMNSFAALVSRLDS